MPCLVVSGATTESIVYISNSATASASNASVEKGITDSLCRAEGESCP